MNIITYHFALDNFIFCNGILDLINIILYCNLNYCWYNIVMNNLNREYLYFAFLYGNIRIYESLIKILFNTNNLFSEISYYYEINITTSIICFIISVCIILSII